MSTNSELESDKGTPAPEATGVHPIDYTGVERSVARRRGIKRKLSYFFAVLRLHPEFALGYIIVATVLVITIIAPLITPYSPVTADAAQYLKPPSLHHLFGTDNTGMDVFTRSIYAPRVDITIAMLGTLCSAVIGTVLGALVGYYQSVGGIKAVASDAIVRAADVLQAFPVFVFAIALVAIMGQSVRSIVFAIAFVNIPIYLRLMRSQSMSIRKMRYVEAALVSGLSDTKIMARHVVPNSIAPVLAQLSVNIGFAIILTAALSFVGAGVRAPTPEWGSMIAMGFQDITTGQWWPSVFPGIAIAVVVFGFALIGSSIEFLSDPAKRATVIGARARQ